MQQAEVLIPIAHSQERDVPMSYEAYKAMEHPTNCLVEWVDGVAIFHMPPNITHQDIAGLIYVVLKMFILSRKLGFVGIAPLELCHTPGSKSREPDILCVLAEHCDRIKENEIMGPADIIFEVVSPSSVTRDRRTKLKEYEQAGVQEYWVIDPRPKKHDVLLYVASNIRKYYQKIPDMQGRYHSVLLPGFWLDPTWLWQMPLPDPRDILHKLDPTILHDPEVLRLAKMEGWELGRTEGITLGRTEGIALGRTEGIALGRTEGITLGKVDEQLNIARNMLADGLSPSVIAKYTKLTPEQIAKLKNE